MQGDTMRHSCHRSILALFVAAGGAISSFGQTISTVAGNSSWGNISDVFVDGAGNIYTTDSIQSVVYKTDRLGAATIIAGTKGSSGYSGDGGLATDAKLSKPNGIVVAPNGTIFFADLGNNRIRKIATDGTISTYAGTGQLSILTLGDGGQATAANISSPHTLALDAQGNLFVTGTELRIRKITPAGIITTVAGTGKYTVSPDGNPALLTDMAPKWIKVGADGTIYYTEDQVSNPRVRKISPNGTVTTIAGTGTKGFSGDGGLATKAQLNAAFGVAVDPVGAFYVSEDVYARIRKVDVNGIISTYAGTGVEGSSGDGGPATKAQMQQPQALALDSGGNLYIADFFDKKVRKVAAPALPAISSTSSVVPSFIGKSDFGSNTYVEIYGTNLSTTARAWGGSDFNGANAPTSLDGVSVTVNNKPAFVYYVSPGQININTPDDTTTGPVNIQVSNAYGVSNVGTANRARLSPTMQSIPQFILNGKSYVVAQTPDFKNFIGTPGMVAGIPFVQAKPGDTVQIYALGCGPTNPPTQAGVVAAQNAPLALPYQVKIGGVPANVSFAGMVANSIGLYQFNVVIPNVAAGDQPIELIVDSVPNAQNLFIVIG
jgi:uncharacterized protein (TIGR03437 family)